MKGSTLNSCRSKTRVSLSSLQGGLHVFGESTAPALFSLSAPDIIRAAFGPAALEGGGLIRKARRCPPSGSQTDESP